MLGKTPMKTNAGLSRHGGGSTVLCMLGMHIKGPFQMSRDFFKFTFGGPGV
jgi:hypothetical protein